MDGTNWKLLPESENLCETLLFHNSNNGIPRFEILNDDHRDNLHIGTSDSSNVCTYNNVRVSSSYVLISVSSCVVCNTDIT